jgi:hypothetical protein
LPDLETKLAVVADWQGLAPTRSECFNNKAAV